MKRFVFAFALLLLATMPVSVEAQERNITGQVTSADRARPLAFAVVELVGGAASVATDPSGNFIVSAPSGAVTLRFSFFGYKTQDVTVAADQNRADVQLEVDVLDLEGIVVTGQATTVARRNLANAVSTVTLRQIEGAPPSESIEKIMQGKVVGALIETNSGAPGGGVQVRLRGVSTINGSSEPLYVVDGMILSNVAIASNANAVTAAGGGSNNATQDNMVNRVADLNPNDIERIEILKGASAAALYGSRAANGVIIITTKKGQAGRPRVSLTQRFGLFQLSNKLNFRKWTRDEALPIWGDDQASAFGADGLPLQQFDFEELLAGESDLSYETSASVSGGDADTRYFISGTWKDDDGIIANTGFQKQSARVNIEQSFGERLRLNVNTNLIHTGAERGLTNNDNSGTSYYMVLPFTPTFINLSPDAEGIFPDNPFERSNPLQTAALATNQEDVWRFLFSTNAQLEIFRDARQSFEFVAIGAVDFFTQQNDLLFPPELQFEPGDGLPGTSLLSNSNNRNLTLSGNLVHNFQGSTGWTSTATVGAQFSDSELNISRIEAYGLTAGQANINSGVQSVIREFRSRIKDIGFFAQEELLLLEDRLLLTGGLRADRSSVSGDTEKFFWYPKAAASYRFDNVTEAIDGLKVRAAWGQAGNQPLFGQKFTPLTATSNIQGLSGIFVQGTAGAADLQPERQTEYEFGVDLTLFDGNATVELTGFQKDISDLILQRTPAPSSGFGLEIFNGGELRVRGLELSVGATPIRRGIFDWVTHFTFYRDYNTVTDLPVPAFETGGFGTSLGAFKIEQGASATQIIANNGRDADGNIVVNKLGDATPDFRIGFANDFTIGDFEISSLVDWSQGASAINLTNFLGDIVSNMGDSRADIQTFTFPDGTTAELGAGERRITRRGAFSDSSGYIEDASYIKIREISVNWNLPQALTTRIFRDAVESAQISLSGRNLYTFTDYTGLDPEVSNFGNSPLARNIDVAPFPPSRSFWLAFNVTF